MDTLDFIQDPEGLNDVMHIDQDDIFSHHSIGIGKSNYHELEEFIRIHLNLIFINNFSLLSIDIITLNSKFIEFGSRKLTITSYQFAIFSLPKYLLSLPNLM